MIDKLKSLATLWSALPVAWRQSAREALFRPPPPASERLPELLASVSSIRPRFIGERLGAILRDELHSLRMLPEEQYAELAKSLIRSIQSELDHILVFWEGHPLHIKGLREVWVACDPPLELLSDHSSTLTVLLHQLHIPELERVVYFVTSEYYIRSLQQVFADNAICREFPGKLSSCLIATRDRPDYPLVLYRNADNSWWGVRGLYHPRCAPTLDGRYSLRTPLQRGWLSYLQRCEAEAEAACLQNHLGNGTLEGYHG